MVPARNVTVKLHMKIHVLENSREETMHFDENEFNRLLVIGMSKGKSWSISISVFTFVADTTSEPVNQPVFLRYKMNQKDWSHSIHPVPFDIKDFNEGIENYSNGMALITEAGF